MSVTAIANLFSGAIYYILLVSMPALLVAAIVGRVFVVLFAWMSNMLGEYTRNLFEMIPRITGM